MKGFYVCEGGESQDQPAMIGRYNAACHAQSNDGQTYIGVGKLNGWPMKFLGDNGCKGMIGDRALISDAIVIPSSSDSLQMVDHTLIDVPLVYSTTKFIVGVMCASSPGYPDTGILKTSEELELGPGGGGGGNNNDEASPAQPSPRRMIIVLDRMPKSKRAPLRKVCCWTSFDEG